MENHFFFQVMFYNIEEGGGAHFTNSEEEEKEKEKGTRVLGTLIGWNLNR